MDDPVSRFPHLPQAVLRGDVQLDVPLRDVILLLNAISARVPCAMICSAFGGRDDHAKYGPTRLLLAWEPVTSHMSGQLPASRVTLTSVFGQSLIRALQALFFQNSTSQTTLFSFYLNQRRLIGSFLDVQLSCRGAPPRLLLEDLDPAFKRASAHTALITRPRMSSTRYLTHGVYILRLRIGSSVAHNPATLMPTSARHAALNITLVLDPMRLRTFFSLAQYGLTLVRQPPTPHRVASDADYCKILRLFQREGIDDSGAANSYWSDREGDLARWNSNRATSYRSLSAGPSTTLSPASIGTPAAVVYVPPRPPPEQKSPSFPLSSSSPDETDTGSEKPVSTAPTDDASPPSPDSPDLCDTPNDSTTPSDPSAKSFPAFATEEQPPVELSSPEERPSTKEGPSEEPSTSEAESSAEQSCSEDSVQSQQPKSPAALEWQRQKDKEGAENRHIDALMALVGLEKVKEQVLAIKAKVDLSERQQTSVSDEYFNVILDGNPGTGKTTVAKHYANFLASVGVVPEDGFIETTGQRLLSGDVAGVGELVLTVRNHGGGALFIDEAHKFDIDGSHADRVINYLASEMQKRRGRVIFIFAGSTQGMDELLEYYPTLASRLPYRLQFTDYTDDELLTMLVQRVEKKYRKLMKVEDGIRGLFGRIAIRRLGRGRGREGFGNARALETLFNRITERQATRIAKQRTQGVISDDFLLLGEDLIGPDPSKAIVGSSAWKKLQGLTGLASVKEAVQNLYDIIEANYRRELQEREPIQIPLNRVFLGSPGTGKTTVAKLYGQILADLGLLSDGEVVVRSPADFIGVAIGQSERKTKNILDATVGKVLVIDEAYMLYGHGRTDQYRMGIIDTLVAEIQSVPGEDRCVLMLGYEDQMRKMFQHVNPGLSRRFAIEDAFRFQDFSDVELADILDLKLKDSDLAVTDAARAVAIDVLNRARRRPNFGNGGEVENLLTKAKVLYQGRQANVPVCDRPFDVIFEPQDFDIEHDRTTRSADKLKQLFEDVIGCEDIVDKLNEYQNIARVMSAQGKDVGAARELIPTNFVFTGPPGTGKTTTARKMGQVYFDMGFLSSADVVECSATELVGEYTGQTGPKTQKLFEGALGKVLFIDEAYRLSEGTFAKEAIDEVVAILTNETFKSKMVVILAGYDADMKRLMAVNSGLSSRFPEVIAFKNLSPEHCLQVLHRELKKMDIDSPVLDDPPTSREYREMADNIQALSTTPSWGNVRDVQTLAKAMTRRVFMRCSQDVTHMNMTLTHEDALACLHAMLKERRERDTKSAGPSRVAHDKPRRPGAPDNSNNSKIASRKPHINLLQRPCSVPDVRESLNQVQADKQAVSEATTGKEEEIQVLSVAIQSARHEAMEREKAWKVLERQQERSRAADAAELRRLRTRVEGLKTLETAFRNENGS